MRALQRHHHGTRQHRRKHRRAAVAGQNKVYADGWLLQNFQQRIFAAVVHILAVLQNVDLAVAVIGHHKRILSNTAANIHFELGVFLFGGIHSDVGVIARSAFFTSRTNPARRIFTISACNRRRNLFCQRTAHIFLAALQKQGLRQGMRFGACLQKISVPFGKGKLCKTHNL